MSDGTLEVGGVIAESGYEVAPRTFLRALRRITELEEAHRDRALEVAPGTFLRALMRLTELEEAHRDRALEWLASQLVGARCPNSDECNYTPPDYGDCRDCWLDAALAATEEGSDDTPQ